LEFLAIGAALVWLFSGKKKAAPSEDIQDVPPVVDEVPGKPPDELIKDAVQDVSLGLGIVSSAAAATSGFNLLSMGMQNPFSATPVTVAASTVTGAVQGGIAGREFAENVSNDWFNTSEADAYNTTASTVGGAFIGGAVGYALPTVGIAGATTALLWVLPVGCVVLGTAAIVNVVASENLAARKRELDSLLAGKTQWQRYQAAQSITGDPDLKAYANTQWGYEDLYGYGPQNWDYFDDVRLPKSLVFFMPRTDLTTEQVAGLIVSNGGAVGEAFERVEIDCVDALRRAYGVSQELGDQTLRLIVGSIPVMHPGTFDLFRWHSPVEKAAIDAAAEEATRKAGEEFARLEAEAAASLRVAEYNRQVEAARLATEAEAARLATARAIRTTATDVEVYSERRSKREEQ